MVVKHTEAIFENQKQILLTIEKIIIKSPKAFHDNIQYIWAN